jgi:hypothetical protein
MNKYTIEVSHINPMETAPVWDYYNGNVETIMLFFKHWADDSIINTVAYYNREYKTWVNYHSGEGIAAELVGWLPDYRYVGLSR